MEQQIKEHYEKVFVHPITKEEIDLLIKHNCECDHCSKSLFEMYDFAELSIDEDEVLCEHCYRYEYMTPCPICEDSFLTPTKADDNILIIPKETIEEYGMSIKPGFYQVKKWPFFYGNCVTGFDGLFDDAIELIRECDINSMLYKLYPHNGKEQVSAGDCCHNCMLKYTGQTKVTNHYTDKAYGRKRVRLEKEVIQNGK
jgi:hypothetical protein